MQIAEQITQANVRGHTLLYLKINRRLQEIRNRGPRSSVLVIKVTISLRRARGHRIAFSKFKISKNISLDNSPSGWPVGSSNFGGHAAPSGYATARRGSRNIPEDDRVRWTSLSSKVAGTWSVALNVLIAFHTFYIRKHIVSQSDSV